MRRHSTKRLAVSAVIGLATLAPPAGLVGAQAAQAAAKAARPPHCTTAGLVVWLDTEGNGAAGSVFYKLELTNLSGHACTLHGFPGVSAVDLHGRQLGRAAAREGSGTAPHMVRLKDGATATAILRIVAAGNFPAATCHQTTAAGLRVFPPGQTTSQVVPFPFEACSRSGPVYLSVRAVR
jgi:Protein of unknown function (DUF4232)